MTRALFYVLVLLFIASSGCHKKTFRRIKVKGRIFHASNNEPFSNADVCLYAGDATSSKGSTECTIKLKCTETNDDGSFFISSQAARREGYCLRVNSERIYIGTQNTFYMDDGETQDLGDIYVDF